MNYKCIKCNKEFHQKSNYEVHIRRKYSCNKKYKQEIDTNTESIIIPPKSSNLPPNASKIPPESSNNPPNISYNSNDLIDIKNNIVEDEMKCHYCNKFFTRRDNLNRHMDERCKIKNKQIHVIENLKLKEENEKLKEENNELKKNFISIYKEIDDIKQNNQIATVSKAKTTNSHSHNTTNTNSHSHNTNNGSINSNNINNIQNNFSVNFGSEDTSRLTDDEILRVLKSGDYILPAFVKTVHANERLPEFSNINITNKRSSDGLIVENGKFVSKKINKIVDDVIDVRVPELKNHAKNFKNKQKITDREYNNINKKLDFVKNTYIETEDIDGNIVKGDKNDVKKLKDERSDIVNAIYDNKKVIMENIKKCKQK